MKNENLTAEDILISLMAELEEAEAAKEKSDSKIQSLKENVAAERKRNKVLEANVLLIKERIKNAENAELREYLEQNGISISDVREAVKDGKIPKSAVENAESAESSANEAPAENENVSLVTQSSMTQKGEENEISDS